MIGETFVSLLPVITGGALTLLGGAVGPVVSYFLTSKKETKRERIEKFEELFELLGDYDHWVELEKARLVFREPVERRPSPLLRAQALCAVYFLDLKPILSEIDDVSGPYFCWMAKAGMLQLQSNPMFNEGFHDAYKPYRQKWLDVMEAVSDYAIRKGDKL